jgi:hypothetical protein
MKTKMAKAQYGISLNDGNKKKKKKKDVSTPPTTPSGSSNSSYMTEPNPSSPPKRILKKAAKLQAKFDKPNPGIGQKIVSKVKEVAGNIKEKRAEKQKEKEYVKTNAYGRGMSRASFMTGGMVNSNAKITADNTPGSKGVKSGINPKVSVTPKGKRGMIVKKKK